MEISRTAYGARQSPIRVRRVKFIGQRVAFTALPAGSRSSLNRFSTMNPLPRSWCEDRDEDAHCPARGDGSVDQVQDLLSGGDDDFSESRHFELFSEDFLSFHDFAFNCNHCAQCRVLLCGFKQFSHKFLRFLHTV
uniref:(northern house mosquito) hypothetical protein n=1 Tax=Culex pipiens TaxID=7175 RepID=A0A8D8NYA6_CULPI